VEHLAGLLGMKKVGVLFACKVI